MITYPKKYKDIRIKYNNDWFTGYMEDINSWRIFISFDGRNDKFLTEEEIQEWCMLEIGDVT